MSNFSMNPEEEKALKEFANIVAEESAVVMSTLLDKKIDVDQESASTAEIIELGSVFPEDTVIVECPFATGFSETNYFLFNKPLVAKLSDLMMMGDGTVEFSEDHIEFCEQAVGTIAVGQRLRDASRQLVVIVSKT